MFRVLILTFIISGFISVGFAQGTAPAATPGVTPQQGISQPSNDAYRSKSNQELAEQNCANKPEDQKLSCVRQVLDNYNVSTRGDCEELLKDYTKARDDVAEACVGLGVTPRSNWTTRLDKVGTYNTDECKDKRDSVASCVRTFFNGDPNTRTSRAVRGGRKECGFMNGLTKADLKTDRDELQRLFDKYDDKREEAEKKYFEAEEDFQKKAEDFQEKMNEAQEKSKDAQERMKDELEALGAKEEEERDKITQELALLNQQRAAMSQRGTVPMQRKLTAIKQQLYTECMGEGQAAINKELERRNNLRSRSQYVFGTPNDIFKAARDGGTKGDLAKIGKRALNRCMSTNPKYVGGIDAAENEFEADKMKFEDAVNLSQIQLEALNKQLTGLVEKYGKAKMRALDKAQKDFNNAEQSIQQLARRFQEAQSTFQRAQQRSEMEIRKNTDLASKTYTELEDVKATLKQTGAYTEDNYKEIKDNNVKAGRGLQQLDRIFETAGGSQCCGRAASGSTPAVPGNPRWGSMCRGTTGSGGTTTIGDPAGERTESQ
ncbi:MAG: hypothetical protein ABL958_15070 [Bdellovibrionia bacterium]